MYHLNELDGHRFNQIVGDILYILLGPGITTYSSGKDGGLDASFDGTSKCFPDDTNPLGGKFRLQAKWTSLIENCNEPAFKRLLIKEEVPKAQELVKNGKLDHWLIFTNRRTSAGSSAALEADLLKESGAKNVFLRGEEDIQRYLRMNNHIPTKFGLGSSLQPLRINPQDIGMIVSAMHSEWKAVDPQNKYNFDQFPGMPEKNKINGMPADIYKVIQNKSALYFSQVENFLRNPRNADFADQYSAVSEEFQTKLIAYFDTFENFGQILDVINTEVGEKLQHVLTSVHHRRILRVILHYMYCNCDIGKTA
jgi:hypothetical protein